MFLVFLLRGWAWSVGALSPRSSSILESPEFHAADYELPRSLVPHLESTNSTSNTPFALSQPSARTSSSRESKRKGLMVDVIENQFAMLNMNLQDCVASINCGNDVADEMVVIFLYKPRHHKTSL